MADLKLGTQIGGNLVWHQGNLRLVPTDSAISYKNWEIITSKGNQSITGGLTIGGLVQVNNTLQAVDVNATGSISSAGMNTGSFVATTATINGTLNKKGSGDLLVQDQAGVAYRSLHIYNQSGNVVLRSDLNADSDRLGTVSIIGSSIDIQGLLKESGQRVFSPNNKPTAADVAALPIIGGTLTGALGVKTINGPGSSISWGSLDIGGIKGGYAGINFSSAGHWFGIQPNGLSGVWDASGNPKWYFNENSILSGGAKVLWSSVIDHPAAGNWASTGVHNVVTGMLAWKNYGNGHVIFDASAGTSPTGSVIDSATPQVGWGGAEKFPTLMGWNGSNTYGVRVDCARYLNSNLISGSGQEFRIRDKRALVGYATGDSAGNKLVINFGGDWAWTESQGNMNVLGQLYAIKAASTNYADAQIQAQSTGGGDVRIGLHRSGSTAAAIVHNQWGITFERESGGSRANVAAANFFADAAQDQTNNALTRLDYVQANFLKYRNRLHPDDGTSLDNVNREYGFNYGTGGGEMGPYISFGGLGGNYDLQISAAYAAGGSNIKFRSRNGDSGVWNAWFTLWNSGNFNPATKLNTSGGTVTGTVYNSLSGAPNTFVGGKLSSESGTLSLDAYTYAFVTSPSDVHLCFNSYYQPSTGWKKYDNNKPSGKIVINEAAGFQYVRSDSGSTNTNQYAYNIWHGGNFNPDSKLSVDGSYSGTIHLGNWFRSYGTSGWFNETYGGGIWMDESTTVKVYAGKKFYVSNSEYNAIGATGGIFSYQRFMVDTRQQIGNGGSFNAYRSIDAPFHAGHGGLDTGTFAPIVGSANYTNGNGYTTRVHLGVRTVGADWTRAVLMVGSAENTTHPLATYEFDAYGSVTGISNISIGTNATIGNDMTCRYAYAQGTQPLVADALTRKDYVDDRDWVTRWETKQVPAHIGGNANSHYNSAWDGINVSNAPSADWYFFRELNHSSGGNCRHQEAYNFFADEEWFRRGLGTAGAYGDWRRRWHSGNFDPGTKMDINGSGGTYTFSNWVRTTGDTGWYNSTYAGGIWMLDTTWVRVSHNKKFYVDNTATDSIYSTGGGNFNDVYIRSDIRLKSGLVKIDSALDKVNSLTGYTFDKKNELSSVAKTREMGIIADDLNKVAPEAVRIVGEDNLLTISPSAVNALLIEAIKELYQEVQDLKRSMGQ